MVHLDNAGNRRIKFNYKQGGDCELTYYLDADFEKTVTFNYANGGISNVEEQKTVTYLNVNGQQKAKRRYGAAMGDPMPSDLFYLHDHLGSSTVTLSIDGIVLRQEEYYPFGETSFGGYASKRYRYTSKERDNETGLYYYGARYYDPFTCRFTGVDPLAGEYAYLSPYNYADNNPVSDKDIDGNQSEKTQTSPGGGGGLEMPKTITDAASNNTLAGSKLKTHNIERSIVPPYSPDPNGPNVGQTNNNTTKISGNESSTLGSMAESVWNSHPMRANIPDFYSVGVGFSGFGGVGAGTSVEANWVTRGPEASLLPAFTLTQSIGSGFSIDATLNVGRANYLGPVKDINRKMLETSIKDGDLTYWGSMDVEEGVDVGLTGSYTKTSTGYGIVGVQANIGLGLSPFPVNGAVGVSNTFKLYDTYGGKK